MKKSKLILAGLLFVLTASPVNGQGTQVVSTSVVYPQPSVVVYPTPSVIPNKTEVISTIPSHNIVVNTGQTASYPYPVASAAPAQRSMESMPIVVGTEQISAGPESNASVEAQLKQPGKKLENKLGELVNWLKSVFSA